jgi:beta-glucosidase-like glycosyl hydrolase
MTAHVFHKAYDPHYPVTLSSAMVDQHLPSSFSGLILSDDMMMGAIQDHFSLETALVRSLEKSIDMVIISCNPLANQGMNASFRINLEQVRIFLESHRSRPEFLSHLEKKRARIKLFKEKNLKNSILSK